MTDLMSVKGLLWDIDSIEKEGKTVIELFVKTGEKLVRVKDDSFKPYFYITVNGNEKSISEKLLEEEFENGVKIQKIDIVEKDGKKLLKLTMNSSKHVVQLRKEIKEFDFYKDMYEFNIPFTRRYCIDKQLSPNAGIEIELDENSKVKKIKQVELKEYPEPKMKAYDLETHAPGRFSNPASDPVLCASIAEKNSSTVLIYKEVHSKNTEMMANEKQLLEKLIEQLNAGQPDMIITYNGDSFDWPFLKTRTDKYKIPFKFRGITPKKVKKGLEHAIKLKGIIHLDAYQMLQLLARLTAVNLIKYDLESVVKELYGVEKEKLTFLMINEIWEKEKDLERLVEYNREDAIYTLKLVEQFLPLIMEIGRMTGMTLFDVSRASAMQLVEGVLLKEAFALNKMVPNKPLEDIVKARQMQPIEGGYVKEPSPGLHENIAVIDFRSLYPSIMVSHNVSYETGFCKHDDCKKGKNLSPTSVWFCEKQRGIIPIAVEKILDARIEAKKRMKELKKEDPKYPAVYARQIALKIILNSMYGTLASPRFRWYSKEGGRAITAWARHYTRMTLHEAEKAGFIPVYADTDSAFLVLPAGKTEHHVKEFVRHFNSTLPGKMELEFEALYKRGIFVTRKDKGGVAKKRYALIDHNDRLKIVGFEYVRRDWSGIARQTQKKVLEAILKDGDKVKAIDIIREAIKRLKDGNASKKELTVMTQIRRPIDSYAVLNPHISAAKKAIEKGKWLEVGSVVSFIITKGTGKISDKAELEEFVKEGNYDPDYYINNQVIPAVIKILAELGYSEEDLKQGGKQSSLGAFG